MGDQGEEREKNRGKKAKETENKDEYIEETD